MPLFGPPDVMKLRHKRDVKGLARALGYKKDAAIREQAAKALRLFFCDGRAAGALCRALGDEIRGVRVDAAEALVKIGAPAVDHLVATLKHPSAEVRNLAAKVLGRIGDTRAVESLVVALADADSTVRQASAGAFALVGSRRGASDQQGTMHRRTNP